MGASDEWKQPGAILRQGKSTALAEDLGVGAFTSPSSCFRHFFIALLQGVEVNALW